MVKKYARLILFIGAVTAAVMYLPVIWEGAGIVADALAPVLIAIFLALIFHIPINWLSGKVLKRIKNEKLRYGISLTVVYTIVFGALAVGLYFLVPELIESIKTFSSNLPSYGGELAEKLNSLLEKVGIEGRTEEIIAQLKDRLLGVGAGATALFDSIKKAGKTLITIFFAIILSVYILLDRKRLIKQIRQFSRAILPSKAFKTLDNATSVGSVIFAKFLGGQVIEAAGLGIITLIMMLILKLPYAAIVSTIVFVANLIPMLGAYVAGIAGFVLIALVSLKDAAIFVILSVVLQQLENNITYPKVVGNSLGLSGFWVMASVLVGGALFGFWGIVLGVPAVAVVYKMLAYKLKKDDASGSLIPAVLKHPDEKGGNDSTQKGSDDGDGNGGA